VLFVPIHLYGKRVYQDPRIVSFALDAFQLQCVALGLYISALVVGAGQML